MMMPSTITAAAGESAHGVCTIDPGRSGQGAAGGGRTQGTGVAIDPPPAGSYPVARPGDPTRLDSAIHLIHTDGALPPSGPRGVVELTAATPAANMTSVDSPLVTTPPAEIPAVGCVRSAHVRPLVTLPAVRCPPQAPCPLGRRPKHAPVDTQAPPQGSGTGKQPNHTPAAPGRRT